MSGPRAESIKDQSGPLTVAKAYLLGFLAGDGHLQYEPRSYSYKVFGCCGQDRDLAEHIARRVTEVYGVPCSVLFQKRSDGVRQDNWFAHCGRKLVVEDLHSLTSWGVHTWRVPEPVMTGDDKIKGAWLRGFADADGYVGADVKRGQRRVCLDSVNMTGLMQAGSLLSALGIRYSWATHNREIEGHSAGHKITLSYHADLKTFYEKVGFECVRKSQILHKAIESYKRTPKRTEDVEKFLEKIRPRREAGEDCMSIAKSLGLTRENVKDLCERRGISPIGGKRRKDGRYLPEGEVEVKIPQILEMKRDGLSHSAIALELGLKDAGAVTNAVQRARRRGLISFD